MSIGDCLFILVVVLLMFLFQGEPDVFDALQQNYIQQIKAEPK